MTLCTMLQARHRDKDRDNDRDKDRDRGSGKRAQESGGKRMAYR